MGIHYITYEQAKRVGGRTLEDWLAGVHYWRDWEEPAYISGRKAPEPITPKPLSEPHHDCANCYHFQEFKHCSCREPSEVIFAASRCPDWHPLETGDNG